MEIPLIKLKKVAALMKLINGPSYTIINDINLEVYSGEIFGIAGPSGSGKTTLLKTIALLLDYRTIKGEYYYKNEQILPITNGMNLSPIRKNIIFLHQYPVLFKGTVKYNIKYGLKIRKQNIDKEYLEQLISSFNLQGLLERNVSSLSGGEKQRVCLLRAMALKPPVLVLDEPTQNLDPANIKSIESNIKKYREEEKGTVIIVTHNLFQARRITDRIGILVNGEIIETGKTEALFASPKNSKTADFLSGKLIF